MRHAHSLGRGGDRTRVDQRDVVANAPERYVRAKGLAVELELTAAELRSNTLAESDHRRRAGADPQVHDSWTPGCREPAWAIEFRVEGGHGGGGRLDGGGHVRQPIIGSRAEEGERHVHELGLHAAQGGEIGHAAERRFSDLGGEWQRDEDPYPRRLEPGGLDLVSDQQRDEHDPQETAEACERCGANTLTSRDEFPCVRDQSTHSDTQISKQRAVWLETIELRSRYLPGRQRDREC